MRTNNDEKIIEHIMESRNTGLSDKIMKWQKLLNFGTQAPVSVEYNLFLFFYNLKIVCACANDAAPEICTIQKNGWYERNTY